MVNYWYALVQVRLVVTMVNCLSVLNCLKHWLILGQVELLVTIANCWLDLGQVYRIVTMVN